MLHDRILIRPATPDDVPRIAEIHIQSWKETYPGIMPQARLDALNIDASMRNWQGALERNDVFLVAVVDGEIRAFAAGGANWSNKGCETGRANACSGELAALYSLRKDHGQGIGRALFAAYGATLKSMGHETMVAWVAAKNPACGFYARMGGELLDKRDLMVMGSPVPIVAYGYRL